MRQKTHYQKISTIARHTAIICAIVAGIGSSIGLNEIQPSGGWFIPVLIGLGIAAVLATGWHLVITGAEKARTPRGVIGVVGGGILLAMLAIGSSGWSLVTAISGDLASQAHMEGTLQEYEATFQAAQSRVDRQAVIPDMVAQAAATYGALARDEESGRIGPAGCGKRCIAYQDVESNYNALAAGLSGMIDGAHQTRQDGLAALASARQAVMTANQDGFRDAILTAGTVIESLKAFDLTARIERIGFVDVSVAEGLSQLSRIDQTLRDKAAQVASDKSDLVVPVFRPISKGEAVIRYFDRVAAAAILALGIDLAPLLLALLILAFAYEPLMRNTEEKDEEARKQQASRVAVDESSVIRAQFNTPAV